MNRFIEIPYYNYYESTKSMDKSSHDAIINLDAVSSVSRFNRYVCFFSVKKISMISVEYR